MCYTTDEYASPKTEVTYSAQFPYGSDGYRTDCNNIPVGFQALRACEFWKFLTSFPGLFPLNLQGKSPGNKVGKFWLFKSRNMRYSPLRSRKVIEYIAPVPGTYMRMPKKNRKYKASNTRG